MYRHFNESIVLRAAVPVFWQYPTALCSSMFRVKYNYSIFFLTTPLLVTACFVLGSVKIHVHDLFT